MSVYYDPLDFDSENPSEYVPWVEREENDDPEDIANDLLFGGDLDSGIAATQMVANQWNPVRPWV